jgi:hypothetical protein
LTRRHYNNVRKGVRELDDLLTDFPVSGPPNTDPVNPKDMTAIQLVNGYNGFGIHTFLSIIRSFPGLYKNYIFISVAEVDVGSFKGSGDRNAVRLFDENAQRLRDLARRLGFAADYRCQTWDGYRSDCEPALRRWPEFPRSAVFAGRAVFRQPGVFHRLSTTKPPLLSSRSSAGRLRPSSCPSGSTSRRTL